MGGFFVIFIWNYVINIFLIRINSTRTITRMISQGLAPGLSLSIIVSLVYPFRPTCSFLILREKQSQRVSWRGPERKVNKYGKLGLTAWGDFKEIFCDIYLELIWNDKWMYIKFVETLREDFFKGINLLKKQNTENKLHTKKY
jgi:hypothetical protein